MQQVVQILLFLWFFKSAQRVQSNQHRHFPARFSFCYMRARVSESDTRRNAGSLSPTSY